jgi:hypothetical protein
MTNAYTKVASGDPLQIPADTYNGLVDVLSQSRRSGGFRNTQRNREAFFPNRGVVLAFNDAAEPIKQYHAAMISGPLARPSGEDDEPGDDGARVNVTVPAGDYAAGRWGIALDGLPAGGNGPLCVAGITMAWIDLVDVAHTHVEVAVASSADATILQSGTSGSATILWIEGGVGGESGAATGEQWALIRIGAGAGGGGDLTNGTVTGQVWQTVSENVNAHQFPVAHAIT